MGRPVYRRFLASGLTVLLTVLLAACGGGTGAQQSAGPTQSTAAGGTSAAPAQAAHVKLAFQPGSVTTPTMEYVAVEQGIFKKHGLEVELVGVSGGTEGVQAVLSGSAHVTNSSPSAAFAAIARGADMVAVAVSVSFGDYHLLSRLPKEKLETGRLGTSGPGLTTDRVGEIQMLKAMGLDASKPTYVTIGGQPQRFSALSEGTIDATVLTTPTLAKGFDTSKITDLGTLKSLNVAYDGDDYILTRQFYDANPKVVEEFCKALIEARAFVLNPANKETMLGIFKLPKYANLSPDQAQVAYENLTTNETSRYPKIDLKAEQNNIEASALVEPETKQVDLSKYIQIEPMATLEKSGYADQFYK